MPELSVMTFNVRQMDGDDGEHAWPLRKNALAETIHRYQPMLLGTQEIFREQADFILQTVPGYACFGSGRFGDGRDKHNLVFYRKDSFSLLDSGEIWFSKTPCISGSADWDIPRPRMITWGLLQLKQGTNVCVMNTHFPYGSSAGEARRQSARILNEKLLAMKPDLPVVVTGDFNVPPGGEIYETLTSHLQDTWLAAQKTRGPEGTVHGFGKFEGPRIDWILQRGFHLVNSAQVIDAQIDGLYPSDHYPMQAVLSIGS